MLYTGGTIGMVQDPVNKSLKPFDFESLLDRIPEISAMDCEIDIDSFDEPIDSSNIKPIHWLRLGNRIAKNYHKYDGFVILHGSDTMAYTASALSFILENIAKPVILTGSQLPIGLARSDAKENLITSIEIATAQNEKGEAMVPEVCIYFEYNLYRGNRTHKISSEDFEAFCSLNYDHLAVAGVNIKYNKSDIATPSKLELNVRQGWSENVGVLNVFPGMTAAFVKSILSNTEMEGLILRTFGSGNAPMDTWFLELLKEAIDRGVYIANISQCLGGAVKQGKYEASAGLLKIGVLEGGDMTLEAGLTKMMYLLGQNLDRNSFKELYQNNIRGELSSTK